MEDYIFLIVASAIAVLIGLWNLMIAVLGCFPKLLCTALRSLAKTNTLKNVPLKHGGCIPNLTKYTYVYAVNGKQYKYSAEKRTHKRNLFSKVIMVYVKGFPRHAYPNKFTGFKEWSIGIFLIILGTMFQILCTTA